MSMAMDYDSDSSSSSSSGAETAKSATGLKRRRGDDGGSRRLLDIGYGVAVNPACVLWVRLRPTDGADAAADTTTPPPRWSLEIALVGAAAPLVVDCGTQVPHAALQVLLGKSGARRRPRRSPTARAHAAVYPGRSSDGGLPRIV